MCFRVVLKLKDINKKRIKISRQDQKKIGINLVVKQSIKQEASEKETYAETINRVITTNRQMTDLLGTMIENVADTPNKMTDLLTSIPQNLRDLLEAVVNERKAKKKRKN